MSFCPQCGSQIRPGTAFCVSCGVALAVPATTSAPAHQPQPTAPYATAPAPSYAGGTTPHPAGPPPGYGVPPRTSPQVDLTRLLRGNWIGAARVALVVLATSGLVSLALALLAKPADFGVDNTLTLVAVTMTGAFGADLVIEGQFEDFEGAGGGGWIPLTVTVLTFAAAIWAFRRMVRPYPRPLPAVADAARVALLVAVPLCVIALVFRSSGDEYGRGWAGEMAAEMSGDDRLVIGASAAGAFFLSLLFVFVVLTLVVVCRRGWSGRPAMVVEWVRAPLLGLATMAALLPLAGLVGVGLLMFGGNDLSDESLTTDDTMAVIALIVGYLGNGGAMLVALGSLASLGSNGEATGESDVSEMHRLWWYTDPSHGNEPGLWAAPLVTVLLLVAGAYVVARASRSRETTLRDLLVWAASMLVFVPYLVRVSSGHGSFSISGQGEDFDAAGYVGPEGWQVTSMFLLLAVVVALVVARLRGALDTTRLRTLARALQSSPAPHGQPPAQQWPEPTAPQHWQEPPTQAQQWGPPRP